MADGGQFTDFLDNFIRMVKRKFSNRASIKDIIRSTPVGYFERSKELLRPRYVGYRFDWESEKVNPGSLSGWVKRIIGSEIKVTYITLYFIQRSAGFKENYLVIMRMPFRQDMDNYRLTELPIQYYCQCKAFQFFAAWVLHQTNNIFLTDDIRRKLGIALTKRPVIRNPKELKIFCKHSINIIGEIGNRKMSYFIDDRYRIK